MNGDAEPGWLEQMAEQHGRVTIAYDHGSLKPWVVELGKDGRSISLGRTLCEAIQVAYIPRVEPPPPPPDRTKPRATRGQHRRFDHDEAARLHATGISQSELARRFGVAPVSIRAAIMRVRRRGDAAATT